MNAIDIVRYYRTLTEESLIILFSQHERMNAMESALLENEIENRGWRLTEDS